MKAFKSVADVDPARVAIYEYWRKHRTELEHPSDDTSSSSWQFASKLGRKYKAAQKRKTFAQDRIAILATLMNEGVQWDAITRSCILYPLFEEAAGYAEGEIPELWLPEDPEDSEGIEQ